MTEHPRGLPDYSWSARRDHLVERVRRYRGRPIVFCAPSGYGKTVAAAQAAESLGNRVLWIDLSGRQLSGLGLCRAMMRQLPNCSPAGSEPDSISLADACDLLARRLAESMGGSQFTVVIDDLCVDDESHVEGIRDVLLATCAESEALLVTSRSERSKILLGLPVGHYIGVEDMRLSDKDALSVAATMPAVGMSHSQILECNRVCHGHVALFEAMARSSGQDGPGVASVSSMIDQAVHSRLTTQMRSQLCGVALLKTGTELEVCDVLGQSSALAHLSVLSSEVPLLRLLGGAPGSRRFIVHDLLEEYAFGELAEGCLACDDEVVARALHVLDRRGDRLRSATVVERIGSTSLLLKWLASNGQWLLDNALHDQLRSLVERVPVNTLMTEPNLLLLWAEMEKDAGRVDEALSRVQAAQSLARYTEDRSTEQLAWVKHVYYLVLLNRPDEAERQAEKLVDALGWSMDDEARAEVEFARGTAAVVLGELDGAAAHFEAAMRLLGDTDSSLRQRCSSRIAVLVALRTGDFASSALVLAPLVDSQNLLLSERLTLRGNLGVCLLETGRLDRAVNLLAGFGEERVPHLSGAYIPMMGCAIAAVGDAARGAQLVAEGIAISAGCDDELSVAANRIYQSALLRTIDTGAAALTAAERAYERLLGTDYMGLKALSQLEISANMLAMNDVVAAATWLGQARGIIMTRDGKSETVAAMISSQMRLLGGDHRAAADVLLEHREHILSGNSNWQIAMYIRAFPELLGAFALAIEPAELPAHMLQMILPEHAERSLLATRGWLPAETWREVGVRLLGSEDFATFVERDGRPLCRVRLFGGLEVNVGGRIIRERDWKKRKARLLFAMLVTRHGNDVARDQVFDHLWPEMDEERAKNNLYVAWSAMKTALMGSEPGRCPYVESVGGVCRVISENVRSDVDEFDSAVAAADAARKAGDAVAELAAYRRISDAYRGDLLPGDVYDDWFAQLRGQYRVAFCDAMVHAAELSIDAEKPVEGAAYVRRAIQTDPLREDLYQMALRCQIASGQRSGAIETYQQCRTRLSEDLGLDPSVETRALYDRILAMEERPGGYARELLED